MSKQHSASKINSTVLWITYGTLWPEIHSTLWPDAARCLFFCLFISYHTYYHVVDKYYVGTYFITFGSFPTSKQHTASKKVFGHSLQTLPCNAKVRTHGLLVLFCLFASYFLDVHFYWARFIVIYDYRIMHFHFGLTFWKVLNTRRQWRGAGSLIHS